MPEKGPKIPIVFERLNCSRSKYFAECTGYSLKIPVLRLFPACGLKCLQLCLRQPLVSAIHRGCLGKCLLGFGILLQIQKRETQPVLVAAIASLVRFKQRSRGLETLGGLRVVLLLQIDLSQRAEREPLLERYLLLPLLVGNSLGLLRCSQERNRLLGRGFRLVELLALLAVVV